VRELTSFLHYLSGAPARFYVALVRRFQVDNVLVLLRLFAGGAQEPSPERYVLELAPEMAVPAGELLSSSDPEEFVAKLPADLAGDAAGTVELYREHGTSAFTEMAIERAYWMRLLEALSSLGHTDRQACAGPLLWELGAARLLAVLRAARSYDAPWEQLRPLLPPWPAGMDPLPCVVLPDSTLQALYDAPTAEAVAARVPIVQPALAESLTDLEEHLWTQTFRQANRLHYGVLEGAAILVSYFYVRRNELRNLTRLAECVYYGTEFVGAA